MQNIVLFGAPGSGKGTQSDLLAKKHGFIHISTGDILRSEVAAQTALGKLANDYISKGLLVPDNVIIDVLTKKLDEHLSAKGVIFDGFPRTTAQAEALDSLLEQRGVKIDLMFEIFVEQETLFDRLVQRGAMSGRSDDTPETILRRLSVYHEKTEPVKQYYRQTNRYIQVDNNGTIDDCFAQIEKIIGKIDN
ncbi:MAG: adenylate kinase [Paludibacter sp.]|jgi:adenylate kinase|nr:adenylate kinase [Paludibacter sp.]